VHVLDALMEPAHPVGVPRQAAALRILKKSIECDVAAAHEIRLAVQYRPAGRRIELELAHAKAGRELITLQRKMGTTDYTDYTDL